ncbi:hypothetical protein SELMODRAFT_405812 [Selaginella moellendorffii]|uniref:GRF-type domain-containing protein n=1 Tax=Selaginella moellendorffii TaxID=88036 RepID=D8QZS5_SELML|nr:hypothetical protein SELMODRAFT_405812 [Selaginella moellendorffii]
MYVKQRIYRLTSFAGVEMMLEESEIEAEIPEKDLEIIWRQTPAERKQGRDCCSCHAHSNTLLFASKDLRTNAETSDISVIMGGNLEPLLTAYLMSKQSSASASGAEEFNYGSRIDHVRIAGPCAGHCQCPDGSHDNSSCDGFAECGTDMCDILLKFKRAKLDTLPRWSGGRSLKLDGSVHAPVILQLKHLPSMKLHNWPLDLCLSFAVVSKVLLISIFRKLNERATANTEPDTSRNVSKPAFTQETGSRKLQRLSQSRLTGFCYRRHESSDKMSCTNVVVHGQSSSLTDGIQQSPELCDNNNCSEVAACEESASLMDMSDETPMRSSQQSLEKSAADLPLCKGHSEPCVVRTVKKAGPKLGRGFYVCDRAKTIISKITPKKESAFKST